MGRNVSEIMRLKLKNNELKNENALMQTTIIELRESLKEQTKLLLKSKPNRPTFTADQRLSIAGKQRFKCANPFSDCHLYKLPPFDGSFDQCGYELDHIIPHAVCYQSVHQMQALCPQCHARKTREDRMTED